MVIKVSCKDYNNAEGEVKYFSDTGNAIGYYDELIEKYKPELIEETDVKDVQPFRITRNDYLDREVQMDIKSYYTVSDYECIRISLQEIKIEDKPVEIEIDGTVDIRLMTGSKIAYSRLTNAQYKVISDVLNVQWFDV